MSKKTKSITKESLVSYMVNLQDASKRNKYNNNYIKMTAKLTQLGAGSHGAIFNADLEGEQKKYPTLFGEDVPVISVNCLTNGLFGHRMRTIPGTQKDPKSVRNYFETLKHNCAHYRGGTVMKQGDTLTAGKALCLDPAVPYNNNRDYKTHCDHSLGIQADTGKNDYPRSKTLYTGCVFFIRGFLRLDEYLGNELILNLALSADTLGESDEEIKLYNEISSWIKECYPTKEDGSLDLIKISKDLESKMQEYDHQVHKRYNPFLMASEIKVRVVDKRDSDSVCNEDAHHFGLKR